MSSREPMWYCHECHAEMRPLMVPDPHCASCNGSFVEKIENPADDPRQFTLAEGGQWDDGALPPEMDVFLAGLGAMLRGSGPPFPGTTAPLSTSAAASGSDSRRTSGDMPRSPPESQVHTAGRNGPFTIRIEQSSTPGGRSRTFVLGGGATNGGPAGNGDIPRLSQFVPPTTGTRTNQDRPNITGPLLAQYLLALMGPGRGGDPFSDLLGGMFPGGTGPPGGTESGRWGDYVFNQEALDQIISQIMENNNAHQPVPASEEVINKLEREVLEEKSPLLEKDCAVCKEQFKLETEDPEEQVVITLPCHHPFHEPCILPWLKTSGTCPVCRHQLVPQPSSQQPGSGPSPPRSGRSNSSSSSGGGDAGTSSGLLGNMFNLFSGHSSQDGNSSGAGGTSSANNARQNRTSGSSATGNQTSQHSSRRDDEYDIPGGWADQVD